MELNHKIRWLFLRLGDFESGLERLLIFPSALLFVLLHFLFCAEDAVYIGTHIEYESEECEMEILKGFEVINLKQPKGESVMTVTSNSLKFNKATAVELNYAPYIRVLLNAKTRQIAIQPCSEKDPNAIKFSNEESKQTYAISIKVPAIQVEFRRMLPFEDDNGGKLSYTLNGTLYPDEQVVIYDIGDVKPETEKKRRGRRKKSEIEAEQKKN